MAFCAHLANNNTVVLDGAIPPASCPGFVLLTGNEYSAWLNGLANWNIDAELIAMGAGGAVLLWSAGFGIGLVISIVRKFRTF